MLCGIRHTARVGTRSAFTLRIRSTWHNTPRRCFAHPSTDDAGLFRSAVQDGARGQQDDSGESSRNGVFMGLVESRKPQNTTMEELLTRIQPRPVGRATQRNDTNSLLTVFVTPAFAQHALDPNLPLHVMQRFNERRVVSKSLDAVVAVVDRLPAPNGATAGSEGLAYAFVSNPLESLSISSQVPLQMSAQKPGSISFGLPRSSKSSDSATVHLPLAQTTFSNGLPSTLIHTHYDFDATSGSLHRSASKRLESQMLSIPFDNATAYTVYDMPFIPLTPVRRIMSSMGNIIRKLSPHSFTQDQHLRLDPNYVPEPSSFLSASQELETAVSDYFKLLGIAPAAVQVWALILPDRARETAVDLPASLLDLDRRVLEALWADSIWQGRWNMRGLHVLQKGCRLARVLSGGGGWGKKAGLLSLDPDTGYSTRDLRSDQGWQFTFEDEYTDDTVADQQRQALGEIVKPGENVMFFLAPKEPNTPLIEDTRYAADSDRAMTFGVIPSSIDDLPESATPGIEPRDDAPHTDLHHHDTFGMLSEGGMAVNLTSEQNGASQTKIDVPFGNLTIRGGNVKGTGLGQYLRGLTGNSLPNARNKTVPVTASGDDISETER
ncbi:uncharacterized protein RCC_10200 [Ramularia collo-cygni]|uniref:Uncharacterized protein n=1 Tax=Ramularia collo-cygni TaxID=112498 RepID=A0A2D3VF40_9PEZI|nr:uncharacterized protein RCC_10200 [Ramularia collo-cygni]CZT24475.1 uncharacterized protein RCC_10200 [Ramularia collo-cygni]